MRSLAAADAGHSSTQHMWGGVYLSVCVDGFMLKIRQLIIMSFINSIEMRIELVNLQSVRFHFALFLWHKCPTVIQIMSFRSALAFSRICFVVVCQGFLLH